MRVIKAKVVGKVVHFKLDDYVFFLSEEEVRRLRAEMNRVVERIVEKRKQ